MTGPADGPARRHHAVSVLLAAVGSAGIQLAAHDQDTLVWLAAAEPDVAILVARLLMRACQAGQPRGGRPPHPLGTECGGLRR